MGVRVRVALKYPRVTPDNPYVYELKLKNPSPLLRSLRHFINNSGSSRDHYDGLREIEKEHNPCDVILSFDQVKRRIQHLSGVVPIEHDMCPESCVAYTGPYDHQQNPSGIIAGCSRL